MSKLACLIYVLMLASCGGEAGAANTASRALEGSADRWPLLVVGPPLTALRVQGREVLLQPLARTETERVATTSGPWVMWAEGNELKALRPFAATPSPLVVRSPSALPASLHIASLHCRGLQCLVGRMGQVDRINLGDRVPAFELVQAVGHSTLKPIDFFVAMGEGIIAVDDMILPKWALILDRDWNYVRSVSLPSGPNEVIVAAAAHRETLVLMSRSLSTGGEFQRVAKCGLVFAEASCEFPYEERDVLAGYTAWHGMTVAGDDALLAAGGRGLVRASLVEDNVRVSHDYGDVLDIVRVVESIYLLVERDGPHLLLLDTDGEDIKGDWALPRGFLRFAR